MEARRLGNIYRNYGENQGTGFAGNVWDKQSICPTLTTMQGGGRQPMIIEEEDDARYSNRYKLQSTEDKE